MQETVKQERRADWINAVYGPEKITTARKRGADLRYGSR